MVCCDNRKLTIRVIYVDINANKMTRSCEFAWTTAENGVYVS